MSELYNKVFAIIVAGGSGVRMGLDIKKQYIKIHDAPIISLTLQVFDLCDFIDKIILVIPKEDKKDFEFRQKNILLKNLKNAQKIKLVNGGNTRQESVYNGLLACESSNYQDNKNNKDKEDKIVIIHDGVRPFVSVQDIYKTVKALQGFNNFDNIDKCEACILAVPAFDSLKKTNDFNYIEHSLDRKNIWLAQTPQTFKYNLIKKAHEFALTNGLLETDDASLIEKLGIKVKIIEGSRLNIKITTPQDLELAQLIYKKKFKEIL